MGFNPRTPCGVRPRSLQADIAPVKFQSTHSLRSATIKGDSQAPHLKVSIHALLAECDARLKRCIPLILSFNPRTPCGVRPDSHKITQAFNRFQSTHSLRSATARVKEALVYAKVSIHALLAECDWIALPLEDYQNGFNPRTPCGVRQDSEEQSCATLRFQSTHSLRSATPHTPLSRATSWFQSTHSLRSATFLGIQFPPIPTVSIHALLAECDCA